jgi:hypothetical protein
MHSKEFGSGSGIFKMEGIRMSIQSCKHAIYHLLQVQLYSHSAGICTNTDASNRKGILCCLSTCEISSQYDPRARFSGIIVLDQDLANRKMMRLSSCLLHLVQDSAGELMGGGVASHVSCAGDTE